MSVYYHVRSKEVQDERKKTEMKYDVRKCLSLFLNKDESYLQGVSPLLNGDVLRKMRHKFKEHVCSSKTHNVNKYLHTLTLSI